MPQVDQQAGYRFSARIAPLREETEAVAATAPWNPLYTASFVRARRMLGELPVLFDIDGPSGPIAGCPAFLCHGRLRRGLRIRSVPSVHPGAERAAFWIGVLRFCREHHVDRLFADTFCNENACVPCLSSERRRQTRHEHVLDLAAPGLWDGLSRNHAWNLRRARRAGLVLRRSDDPDRCRVLARLHDESMRRRTERGEPRAMPTDLACLEAYVRTGAGVIYEALLGDEVVSSMLVLVGARGAYFQSAGSGAAGMACGASHFLYRGIAEDLRSRGLVRCSIGGVGADNAGLDRFKDGFGGREVPGESAEFDTTAGARRLLLVAAQRLRAMRSHG